MKQFFTNKTYTRFLLIATLVLAGATAQAQRLEKSQPRINGTVLEQIEKAPINKSTTSCIEDLLNYAYQFRGVRYRSGASGPGGFDCSGFTSYVFKKFGYRLNRRSSAQASNGRRVSRNELRPGDLVFFNGRARGSRIGHVGIVTEAYGDGTFKFIHSACRRGVSENKSTESYYRSRYMGASRVIE